MSLLGLFASGRGARHDVHWRKGAPASPLRSLLGVILIVISAGFGCSSNAFKESYRSSLERWPSGEVSRLAPKQGPVEIVTTDDVEADSTRMMEAGYLLLGRSKFRGEQVSPDAAREVAGDLNASVVLLKTKYAKTVTEAVPIERWTPMRSERSARDGRGAGWGKGTIHGEFRVTYFRRPVDHYDHAATFWAKSRQPIFGVLVEARGASGGESGPSGTPMAGRGVVVRAVIHDSPAYRAGVLSDDVIVRFSGTEIVDPDQFFDVVVANKGRAVEVEFVRVAEPRVIKAQIQLRDE